MLADGRAEQTSGSRGTVQGRGLHGRTEGRANKRASQNCTGHDFGLYLIKFNVKFGYCGVYRMDVLNVYR